MIDRWDPARGGAERAMALLARRAAERGHEVLVLCLDAAPGAPGDVRRLARPRRPRGDLEVAFARAAVAAAREARCDATLGIRHLEEIDVYWPHGGLHRATLAAGERSRGRVAGGVSRALHGLSRRHRVFLRMEERLLAGGGARRVWCVSALVRDEIAAAFPCAAARLDVRPNGVDLQAFHPGRRAKLRRRFLSEHGLDPARPTLLFLGGNWRLKGWDVLVAALRRTGDLPWTLIAAGDRPPVAAGRRAPLSGRAAVLPRTDAATLHAAADLLVQPTFRDPCSLATLEALASGVPVVTTRANGAADAIPDARAGAVIDAPDADLLASALRNRIARLADPAGAEADRVAARAAAERRPVVAWLDGLADALEDAATS